MHQSMRLLHTLQLESRRATPFVYETDRLCYETDSQTSFHSVMGMKGNASTFPGVKELRLVRAAEDMEIHVVWNPRAHADQQVS